MENEKDLIGELKNGSFQTNAKRQCTEMKEKKLCEGFSLLSKGDEVTSAWRNFREPSEMSED